MKRLQAASGFLFRPTRSSTWWKWNRKDFEMYAKLPEGKEGQMPTFGLCRVV
jgi:hypothetical protein